MQYFPRLDGIRALAVIGVLLVHFAGQYVGHAQTGRLGVRVFFVLSGFLITRILIDYRARMTVMDAAKAFYWRRLLRLAPAYYFAIMAAAAIGIANMRQDWPWHAAYLSNVLFDSRQIREPAGHFWTLVLEEQFYILWFAVVAWLPKRRLLPVTLAAIVIAPLWRTAVLIVLGHNLTLVPAVMDFFGFGALIGIASIERPRLFAVFASWPLFAACLASVVGLTAYLPTGTPLPGVVIGTFAASFIALAATPETRGMDWLNWAPLRDMGKISYGIYIYHKFVPLLFERLGFALANPVIQVAVYFWVSIVVAAASWVLIEKPALAVKDIGPRTALVRTKRLFGQ